VVVARRPQGDDPSGKPVDDRPHIPSLPRPEADGVRSPQDLHLGLESRDPGLDGRADLDLVELRPAAHVALRRPCGSGVRAAPSAGSV